MIFKRCCDPDFFYLCCKWKDGSIHPVEAIHRDTLSDFLPNWIWQRLKETKQFQIIEIKIEDPSLTSNCFKDALLEISKIERDEKSDGSVAGELVHTADEMAEIAETALKVAGEL